MDWCFVDKMQQHFIYLLILCVVVCATFRFCVGSDMFLFSFAVIRRYQTMWHGISHVVRLLLWIRNRICIQHWIFILIVIQFCLFCGLLPPPNSLATVAFPPPHPPHPTIISQISLVQCFSFEYPPSVCFSFCFSFHFFSFICRLQFHIYEINYMHIAFNM